MMLFHDRMAENMFLLLHKLQVICDFGLFYNNDSGVTES